jgi:hypothetical protein
MAITSCLSSLDLRIRILRMFQAKSNVSNQTISC